MKDETKKVLQRYVSMYEFIGSMETAILEVFHALDASFRSGGKLLVCGNGGSAADADHIVGELVKGFTKKRPFSAEQKKLYEEYGTDGIVLADKLQGSLPAISLCAHTSLITAVINDIGGDEIYAQQVIGYGRRGDVLIGISTSGNSKNVLYAGMAAKTQGVKTIALTGVKASKMSAVFDISIRVPSCITCDIQDMHTIIYHILCAMVETELWDV
jgi:D-sedoheptulose 7-phosphate isomerase